jgi:hypothetical protein
MVKINIKSFALIVGFFALCFLFISELRESTLQSNFNTGALLGAVTLSSLQVTADNYMYYIVIGILTLLIILFSILIFVFMRKSTSEPVVAQTMNPSRNIIVDNSSSKSEFNTSANPVYREGFEGAKSISFDEK